MICGMLTDDLECFTQWVKNAYDTASSSADREKKFAIQYLNTLHTCLLMLAHRLECPHSEKLHGIAVPYMSQVSPGADVVLRRILGKENYLRGRTLSSQVESSAHA